MNFEFATAQRILFGPGVRAQIVPLASSLGQRPLLITGAHPDRLEASIRHISPVTFPIPGEPTFALVRAATSLARAERCDSVVAVGGGSVLDAAKAVAMLVANGGDPMDYAEVIGGGQPILQPSIPLIAVPTTAGAGAEVTRNAVLTSPEHRLKVSLRSPHLLPACAVVDPELTLNLPPSITATTGMDALAQVIEPFVSRRANPITDTFCREGMSRIARSLRSACSNPADLAARSDMALGALLGGLALANAGLGAVHGFASPIGGTFPAPHGAVCAALLPPVFEANSRAVPDPSRFIETARLLTGSPHASVQDAVNFLSQLRAELSVPNLGKWGVTETDIPQLCIQAAQASSMKANPVVFSLEALAEILAQAL